MSVIPSIILSAALSCGSSCPSAPDLPADVQGIINTIENSGCAKIECASDIESLKDTLSKMGVQFNTGSAGGNGCGSFEDVLNDYINSCNKNSNQNCNTGSNCPNKPVEPDIPAEPDIPEPPKVTAAPKPTEAPKATQKPTAKPTEAPKATTAPSTDSSASSYALQVVDLVNQERAKYGLSALSVDSTLMSAAQKRAMETVTSFSHTRPNGSSFSSVLSEYNYSYRSAGENIAYGQRTPQEVVNAWMNSSGHRANILNSKYTKIGVGCYKSGSTYYWSQLFAG